MGRFMAKFTRRTWLESAGGWAVGAAAGASWLAGCRPRGSSSGRRVLKVFNWSDYIAPEVIPAFEAAHDCTVVYDNFASDSELEARLATGGGAYDVVFPSDRTMHALVAKQLLAPLDRNRLSNWTNLDHEFLSRPHDPRNEFSAPYFWGTLAAAYLPDFIDEPVTGFDVLLDPRRPVRPARLTMLDDGENVIGGMLMHLGRPLNSVAAADLAAVQALLLEQRPRVQAYTSDSYKERLVSGDAWAAMGWSGDLLQAATEAASIGREVRVVVPERGTIIWLDSMAIPRGAQNVELAHAFIDWLLDAEQAAANAEYVSYATPNGAALALLPAEMRADESIYPPAATRARCEWLENRGREITKIEAVWRTVKA
jgi:spermidine/putrescine transport system substrate-binding protein